MPPGEFSEALLLRGVDYGDADRIVTLLTRRFGKISLIARAARRSRRRFGGALSPLLLLNVEVRKGRGELLILGQAQVTRAYARILGSLARMSAGFEGLSWLRELTAEHEPDDGVFSLAAAFLDALDAEPAHPEELLLCFQACLLGLAGFSPNLRVCGACARAAEPARAACFDVRGGHLMCRACGGASHLLGGQARAALLTAMGGALVEAAAVGWPDRQRSDARSALRAFAEHRLGRPLNITPLG